MKLSSDNLIQEKFSDFVITPVSHLTNQSQTRPSSCCRISVRIPSVEPEESKKKSLQKFPLRSSSVPKIHERPTIHLTPSVSQVKITERQEIQKNFVKSYKNCLKAYQKYLSEPIDTVLASQVKNMAPLPDPHIKEHKRAALRLRKLKRVMIKCDKENNL
jgi:hypothetical protein